MRHILTAIACLLLASSANGQTYFSSYKQVEYMSTIEQSEVKTAPAWLPDQKNPPLAVRDAISSASAYLTNFLQDGKRWTFESVTLRSVGVSSDNLWVYVVSFSQPIDPESAVRHRLGNFHIVVLMDKSVVELVKDTRQ